MMFNLMELIGLCMLGVALLIAWGGLIGLYNKREILMFKIMAVFGVLGFMVAMIGVVIS